MDNKKFAIAIDGPVAAGKGTVALQLAHNLDGLYLYTGAMYRSLALTALENNVDLRDEDAIVALLPQVHITFKDDKVFLNGRDVTETLKEEGPANGSSIVAQFPKVREQMVLKQQAIANEAIADGKIVISEGRDTGTKVFPDSPFKVYLTASAEERAKRRLTQFHEQGRDVNFDEVLAEVRERDERDMSRAVDPLPSKPAELGYFIVNDSGMAVEETVQIIEEELRERRLI